MKSLSIKQPWCSLIAMGAKPVENRSRNTNYRGRIYLHSSGQPMKGEVYNIIGLDRWESLNKQQKVATWESMKLNGAIIGEANIIDCVRGHTSIWADHKTLVSRKINGEIQLVEAPCYQWVLSDVVMYEQPILSVKGMLGLWNYERPFEVVGRAELVTI